MTLDRARFCMFAVMSVTFGDAAKLSKSAEFCVNGDDLRVNWNAIHFSTVW